MSFSRRTFLETSSASLGLLPLAEMLRGVVTPAPKTPGHFDPWLEIDPAALAFNTDVVRRAAGGRPIIAMVKNNAYGLGLVHVGPALDRLDAVAAFGVVRVEEALTLRRAGVRKPIVLLGPCDDEAVPDLVRDGVRLSLWSDDDPARVSRLARAAGRPVPVHLYIDTGMHRMGMPYRAAAAWIAALARSGAVRIEGALTELTEDPDFDREQAERLRALAAEARGAGNTLGTLHAASSDAVARGLTETFLDAVRPGFALYGGYVSDEQMARGELRCAYRLRARVLRVERLEAGEGVSYHRRYRVERPTWIAALPVGHVDGYPTRAIDGAEVLIRGRLFRVVGYVSASHTIVEIGPEPAVQVGDEAILVGPDHPNIHPNTVAKRAGSSEYNMFMHLSPALTRVVRA